MAGQVKHVKIFSGIVPGPDAALGADAAAGEEHGRADFRGRRRDAGPWHRADGFDRAARRRCSRTAGVLTASRAVGDEQRDRLVRLSHGRRRLRRSTSGRPIAVKDAAVVAVEAMEGTDEMIAPRGAPGWPRRAHREGGQAEPGHALRRAGRRRRHHRGDARGRSHGALDRRGPDARVRSAGASSAAADRRRHRHRRHGACS